MQAMTIKQFIFSEKKPQRFYRHVVFWLLYYLFSLLTYFHPFLEKTSFGKWMLVESVEVFSHVLIQIIFCYALLYILLPRFFYRKKYIWFITGLLATSFIVYWLSYFQIDIYFRKLHAWAGIPFLTTELVYYYCFISFISYCPISAGLAVAFKVLKYFYVKKQENQALTIENANAELQLLKAQVHPHFLFNTLNNIYSFTIDQSLQAPGLVMNLSDTLQYMITDCDAAIVPLAMELKMIRDYIDLEKIRYEERLDMKIEIAGDIGGKMVVPLLLIPFVENSFKHGASKMMGDVWITLFIQVDKHMLHFTLINSKPSGNSSQGPGGIGLVNVKKRLELLYPGNYYLQTESSEHTFTVNMQVPLETIPVQESARLQINHHI
jgi:hypothetical protein